MIFADVIVDISVKSLDRPFQYIVPEEMIDDAVIGAMVIIPFGSGNRELKGYIIGLSGEAKFDVERTKAIKEIVKQGVVAESHLLSLAYWIKENYGSTMNDAIKAVLPVRREIKKKVSKTVYPCQTRSELEQTMQEFAKKHNQARVRVLQALLNQEDFEQGIPYERLKQEAGTTMAVLHGLEEKEIVSVTEERQYRNPVMRAGERDQQPVLNDQQRRIVDTVTGDYRQGIRKTYLIHGVTGSGKTEVYMGIIEKVIAEHKQVIVLIPEIALTFQTVSRFYRRFGERVSVMHSRLSQGEKFDQFERAKAGEIDIMIGPRSALFTPFEHLGLIVIDEEHETSYQSEMCDLRLCHTFSGILLSGTKGALYVIYADKKGGRSQSSEGLGDGPSRGAGTEEPVNLWRKADGAYAGPACEKGTDHPVFKPARLCGFRVLPKVW